MMIWGLWYQKAESTIGIKLGNTDTDYYIFDPIPALLAMWEKINKGKHDNNCHNQQKHFSMNVISVNSILGREALAVLPSLSQLVAEKWTNLLFTCRDG